MNPFKDLFVSRSPLQKGLLLVMMLGVGLALFLFLHSRSLWLDEAMLSMNILERDFTDLLLPLDRNQAAPIGYLFLERLALLAFGPGEKSLRLFSLLSFLCTIPLVYRVSIHLFKNADIAFMTTASYCITVSALAFSCEVKQYSGDVLIAQIILLSTFTVSPEKLKSLGWYGLMGGTLIWFSNISVIMLFVCGSYLLFTEGLKKKNFRIWLPITLWACSFAIYYALFIHDHPSKEYMLDYWRKAFMPINPFSSGFWLFMQSSGNEIFAKMMGYGPFWVCPAIVFCLGIGFMVYEQQTKALFFCLAPVAVHFAISAFELYPFSQRLVLYTLPLMLMVFSTGVFRGFKWFQKTIINLPDISLTVPVLILFYPLILSFPFQREEVKTSLKHLETYIRDTDSLYVYYSSIPSFEYYVGTNYVCFDQSVISGSRHRDDLQSYNREILNLNGKVWLFFSHIYPPWNQDYQEDSYMIDLLLDQGGTVLDVQSSRDSHLYYVDTGK
jgi:hypothetical protein